MKIIGFAGPAGVGKNTAALALATDWQTKAEAIAGPLYDGLSGLIGMDTSAVTLADLCEDRTYKRTPCSSLGNLTPRRSLQLFGDWVRQTFGQDYLLKRLEARLAQLENFQDTPEILAITDIRTEPETNWVRRHGGLVIHVSRGDTGLGKGKAPDHSTEQPLTFHQGDLYALNAGTVDDLEVQVRAMVRCWLGQGVAA